jgi:IS30 family transposase
MVMAAVARFSERLVPEVTARLWDLRAAGIGGERIAPEIGWKSTAVFRLIAEHGGVRPASAHPGRGVRLSFAEREEIMVLAAQDVSARKIALQLGRAHTTISRELKRGRNGQWLYRATNGQRIVHNATRRPKPARLLLPGPLRERVLRDLRDRFSPEQIAGRLKREFPDDPTMWVSHETIYQAIYRDRPGRLTRANRPLTRMKRTVRKPRRVKKGRLGRIQNMVSFRERDPEADGRLVPGHLEGDLIIGRKNRGAIGTLVDRATGRCFLFRVDEDQPRAIVVRDQLIRILTSLPVGQARSVTWDQGVELHRHREVTEATGVPVFFADPRSPWQRGSNENMNKLLREYYPRGTVLTKHPQKHLNDVAAALNRRPRKRYGYATPNERLTELTGALTD